MIFVNLHDFCKICSPWNGETFKSAAEDSKYHQEKIVLTKLQNLKLPESNSLLVSYLDFKNLKTLFRYVWDVWIKSSV